MIQIKTNGEAMDLPSGFSMEIEDSNPIFNDRGSQSLPATVPATRRNIRLLDAPHRIENNTDPNLPEREAEVIAGTYIRKGVVNLTEASRKEGFTMNIGFDNSTAYMKWQEKKLSKLDYLPVYTPADGSGTPVSRLLAELTAIYKNPAPHTNPFAVFPLALRKEEADIEEGVKRNVWEILNTAKDGKLTEATKVSRVLDNEVTEVSVPAGYMVSPFVRVWKVLELIFQDLGVTVSNNMFKTDTELARLVVLNNCADGVCIGQIKYADLLPDCTVSEFLNALWVRFGLVYNVDYTAKTVRLELLKDILEAADSGDLTQFATEFPKIVYQERQYVKLSATTTIEGAAPSTDRLEDFLRGMDITKVAGGPDVDAWNNRGTPENLDWDGDYMDGYYDDYDPDRDGWEDPDEPEGPEPEEPEPDDGNYSTRSAPAKAAKAPKAGNQSQGYLAREFVTGQWWRTDPLNNSTMEKSSSFFNWDPQTEGVTAMELQSKDECVPIGDLRHPEENAGDSFTGYCPLYLFGSRHYHSSIKGSDTKDEGDSTPLAFLFAYTKDSTTMGRINGEGEDGQLMKLDDGTRPRLSLYFQFKDGLFANFWTKFDEILRHNNRQVEVKARIDKRHLQEISMLKPYGFNGVRVLVDTMNYTLPAIRDVQTDLKLRPIQTQGQGYYDITAEQNIPNFAAAARHLAWHLYSETYGPNLDNDEARQAAVNKYIQDNNYMPHGTAGDYYFLSAASATFKSMERDLRTWEIDRDIPDPTYRGEGCAMNYTALLTYYIWEIHDTSATPGSGGAAVSPPLGEVTVMVQYRVKLYAAYVPD